MKLKKKPIAARLLNGGNPSIVSIDLIDKNGWNMNQMQPSAFKKLKVWVERSYRESGKLALPVVLRTHPDKPGRWQIIDGYHRYLAVQELGKTEIDCWIYECDDKAAMLLTDALNYLRGDPNPDKYADYVKELSEAGVSKDEMVQFTHMNSEELTELLDTYDIKIEDIPTDEDAASTAEEDEKKPDEWIEMKFLVPRDAAEIVEAELARVSSILTGKNMRGRALEYMAVQSAQTPLPDGSEDPAVKIKKKLAILGRKRVS